MERIEQFQYKPAILEALLDHGLRPAPTTNPQVLRDAVSELYRFEIRKLRDRTLAGDIARNELAGHVIALRKRYVVLSIPIATWTS